MNRRAFLFGLAATAATVAKPKFIFDMGANLWRPKERSLTEIMAEVLEKNGYISAYDGGFTILTTFSYEPKMVIVPVSIPNDAALPLSD